LRELGHRLEALRLQLNISQEDLSRRAGVGRRTVTRMEAGEPVSVTSLVRVLRSLGLLRTLEQLVPEVRLSPIELLEADAQRPRRKRARARARPQTDEPWTWGDEQ
jgi:transcriptional regulator with XRE-family HTH domain